MQWRRGAMGEDDMQWRRGAMGEYVSASAAGMARRERHSWQREAGKGTWGRDIGFEGASYVNQYTVGTIGRGHGRRASLTGSQAFEQPDLAAGVEGILPGRAIRRDRPLLAAPL